MQVRGSAQPCIYGEVMACMVEASLTSTCVTRNAEQKYLSAKYIEIESRDKAIIGGRRIPVVMII